MVPIGTSDELQPQDFLDLAKALLSYQDRLDYIEYCLKNLKGNTVKDCYAMGRAWVDGRLSAGSTPPAASQTAPATDKTTSHPSAACPGGPSESS